jgi:hypothetical protein
MSDEIEIKLPDLARVALEPGDKILVRYPKRITQAAAEAISANLNKIFPDHAVMILDDGLDLAVIRPTDPREDQAWRLDSLQFLMRTADEAMRKEGVIGDLRNRVMTRLIYGEPTTEDRIALDPDEQLAQGRSL